MPSIVRTYQCIHITYIYYYLIKPLSMRSWRHYCDDNLERVEKRNYSKVQRCRW